MRRIVAVVLSVLMALGVVSSTARADTRIEDMVSAASFQHTYDAELHTIAHQRAVEIASNFSHDGRRSWTAEIIGYNSGFADPEATVVQSWLDSAPHYAIITDRTYTRIGCGSAFINNTYWFACVFAAPEVTPVQPPQPTPAPVAPAPTQPAQPSAPQPQASTVPVLPDTAMLHD